jgi:methylthioribose-1-phosphate isomerase
VKETATLWWDDELAGIRYIDQTLLPTKYAIVRCTSVDRLITAIKRLEIRGAPALGVAGGYGVALAVVAFFVSINARIAADSPEATLSGISFGAIAAPAT